MFLLQTRVAKRDLRSTLDTQAILVSLVLFSLFEIYFHYLGYIFAMKVQFSLFLLVYTTSKMISSDGEVYALQFRRSRQVARVALLEQRILIPKRGLFNGELIN